MGIIRLFLIILSYLLYNINYKSTAGASHADRSRAHLLSPLRLSSVPAGAEVLPVLGTGSLDTALCGNVPLHSNVRPGDQGTPRTDRLAPRSNPRAGGVCQSSLYSLVGLIIDKNSIGTGCCITLDFSWLCCYY